MLEEVCTELDGGVEANCFASGMAAACALFETVNPGEHVAVPRVMYHGVLDWLTRIANRRSIGVGLFDAHDSDASWVLPLIRRLRTIGAELARAV